MGLRPIILALEGPLGAGKTTLTKELAKVMGVKDEIVSPTFVLHRQYEGYAGLVLNHIDCYRMEEFGELLQIGLRKMIGRKSLIVIEWADKFEKEIKGLRDEESKVIWVKMKYGGKENERKIRIYENSRY